MAVSAKNDVPARLNARRENIRKSLCVIVMNTSFRLGFPHCAASGVGGITQGKMGPIYFRYIGKA